MSDSAAPASRFNYDAGFMRGRLFTKEALARFPVETPQAIQQDMAEIQAKGEAPEGMEYAHAVARIGDLMVYLYEAAKALDNDALGFAPESHFPAADYEAGFHHGFSGVAFVRSSPSLGISREVRHALDQFFHRLGQLAAERALDLTVAWLCFAEMWGGEEFLQPHHTTFLDAFEARALFTEVEPAAETA